jgi:hypothetical protein
MISQSPLHRSGRAAFPHPALASGEDAKTAQRVGMTHACGWQPPFDEPRHPGPQDTAILAAARQGAADLEPEAAQRGGVHGHSVVSDAPTHDRIQPSALLRGGIVHASLKFGLTSFNLACCGAR